MRTFAVVAGAAIGLILFDYYANKGRSTDGMVRMGYESGEAFLVVEFVKRAEVQLHPLSGSRR